MMLSDEDLFDAITLTALRGSDVDLSARSEVVWRACRTLMAEILREADPFTAERLLRGLVPQLRESAAHLDELLRPHSSPWPTTPTPLN